MATTPDWLTALNAQGGRAYTDPSGMQYVPLQTNGPNGPMDGYASIAANTPGLGGIGFNDFNTYDGQGNGTGTKQLGYSKDSFIDYMPYLIAAAVGGGAMLNGGFGAAGAGAGSGASGALPTGGGALDFGGAGATVGGPMSIGGANGTALSALAPETTGGGLSSLFSGGSGLGGLGSLLGPALGGLLGSKPTTTGTTSTKNLPGYLQPSVTGLLAQTDALRNKLMAPGAMQGYDDMRSAGQNMLNAPIAGNGVGKVAYPTQFGFKR